MVKWEKSYRENEENEISIVYACSLRFKVYLNAIGAKQNRQTRNENAKIKIQCLVFIV